MSVNILKSFGIVLCGAVFGYSIVQFLKPEPKNRFIASAQISKMGQEQNARSLFDVRLDLAGLAKQNDGISTIIVRVEALKPFGGGLLYKWNLPADVQILEGVSTEPLPSMAAGESRDYVLKVKGFSKEFKKYASFEIEGEINQHAIRREVLISSRLEDSLEYLIQQNELKSEKNSINKLGNTKKSRFDLQNVVR